MIREKSCGAIPWRRRAVVEFLLVQQRGGHWDFPKGHVEKGETERQTALREVKEETGLEVELAADFRRTTKYSPRKGHMKLVVFFLGKALTEELSCTNEEIIDYRWLSFEKALRMVKFENTKNILRDANAVLTAESHQASQAKNTAVHRPRGMQ